MSDDLKQQSSVKQVIQDSQKIDERPMDPTRDAEDFLGDPSGRTGVTTGDPSQISAEPDDSKQDDSMLGGGSLPGNNPTGFTKDEVSDEAYDHDVLNGMSRTEKKYADDMASEDELLTRDLRNSITDDADDPMGTSNPANAQDIPIAESGEETASGSAPGVESDDDVGEMMKAYTGRDPDPDMDNPQELGAADPVDEAEEEIRES